MINIKYYQYKTEAGNGNIYQATFVENSTVIDHVEVLKNGEWVKLSDRNWVVLGMKKWAAKILRGEDYRNYTNIHMEEQYAS